MGKAKYTELTPSDIMKLISRPSSSESLEHRIAISSNEKTSSSSSSSDTIIQEALQVDIVQKDNAIVNDVIRNAVLININVISKRHYT